MSGSGGGFGLLFRNYKDRAALSTANFFAARVVGNLQNAATFQAGAKERDSHEQFLKVLQMSPLAAGTRGPLIVSSRSSRDSNYHWVV
ncbi:MAG: hypothetical protein HJJLKODD_00300 [Phycisphaerae bacterium]|nr:hypothetical protein [Phycisphaerae bacterium]